MIHAAVTIDPAIAILILAGVALLFTAAAVHKFRDLRRFDEIFAAYGLFPSSARPVLSRLVPPIEAAVAAGLSVNALRTAAVCVGILMLVAYAAAIAVNLLRGRSDLACGCGGPDDRRPIAAWMVCRNILIAALLVMALLPWSARPLVATDAVTIVFGILTCTLVYLCLDRLLGRTGRLTAAMRMS